MDYNIDNKVCIFVKTLTGEFFKLSVNPFIDDANLYSELCKNYKDIFFKEDIHRVYFFRVDDDNDEEKSYKNEDVINLFISPPPTQVLKKIWTRHDEVVFLVGISLFDCISHFTFDKEDKEDKGDKGDKGEYKDIEEIKDIEDIKEIREIYEKKYKKTEIVSDNYVMMDPNKMTIAYNKNKSIYSVNMGNYGKKNEGKYLSEVLSKEFSQNIFLLEPKFRFFFREDVIQNIKKMVEKELVFFL